MTTRNLPRLVSQSFRSARLPLASSLFLTSLMSIHAVAAPRDVQFNRDVRPILADKCFACHGPDEAHREAGLRFDLEESAKALHDGAAAIVPGQPEASHLLTRITTDDADLRMPPTDSGKELSQKEIDTLRRWIADGAKYESHWSFLPPSRPTVPEVDDEAWPVNDIDRFILARLEREGLRPSPEADRATLIRRLSFDLVGLPPSIEEVDAFVGDQRPDAYERLVDRLLESPHFGERMAMYWLDLVRYANTVGYHGDQEHAITPYRDWVIHAFNTNLPFDQFTAEQLAGDLLPDRTTDQRIASGYNRLLQTSHEGGVQVKEYLSKYDADRVRNVSSVWMGATVGCAQCHDHKYDPYTMRDFYSLAAFFADVDDARTFRGGDTTPTKREPEIETLSPLDRLAIERLREAAASCQKQIEMSSASPTGAESQSARAELESELKRIESEIAAREKLVRRTMVTESVEPRVIRVLARGDWMDDSGEIRQPAIPAFLGELNSDQRPSRLDLARWLTSPDHPQTSRVFMNRLWYLYFGVGLTKTLDDTGSQGEWPTHPELLDYLGREFSDNGWNIKRMVKLLVMSHTYRQTSSDTPELLAADPENRLFARQARFRLPAELIRDNALAVSGLLVDRLGGASSHPYQPAGYYTPLNFPRREYRPDKDDNQYRRGVYMHWQRQFLHPMLRAFDAPSREECTVARPISNTPLAALTLLNDPTFVEAARVFAERIMTCDNETNARIRWAWRQALSREPTAEELAALADFAATSRDYYRAHPDDAEKLLGVGLAKRSENVDAAEMAAWTNVARAILNLNETITRN